MPSSQPAPPGLISLPRITTLIAALLAALGAGTNYAYSVYAPQLGARLHINHTQLNLIALGANVGGYLCAPISGKFVDSRGPRPLFVVAFLSLLLGYAGFRFIYDEGLSASEPTLSTFRFALLIFFALLTGLGGNFSFAASVNSTAKTFPDRARATATGLVISGFGLSAFLFSTIAHYLFPGDTSSFLLTLSLGTALPQLAGLFFVRAIPLPPSGVAQSADYEDVESDSALVRPIHVNDSHTHLLARDVEDAHLGHRSHPMSPSEEYIPDAVSSIELSPPRSTSRHRSAGRRSLSRASKYLHDGDTPNVFGKALFCHPDFWLTFTIVTLLGGTGLMYINNVGSIAQTLFAKGNTQYDPVEAASRQAKQVSIISVMNFAGRILSGFLSDFVKNRLKLPRSYCYTIIALGFLCSQLMAASVEDIENLWKASASLGLVYGSVFVVFPNVCIEWFGMTHFSENWGYLSISPVLGGNVFSLAFGRILDSHGARVLEPKGDVGSWGEIQCLDGRDCYVGSLHMTISAACLAVIFSVWAGWRDRERQKQCHEDTPVVWLEDED